MTSFATADAFAARDPGYTLLPFRFATLDDKQIVVNEAGEHHLLDREEFGLLVSHRLPRSSSAYLDLKAKHFLTDTGLHVPVSLLAVKYRTKRSFLAGFTKLHIFVVSLRCDHSCKYCQVSRVSVDHSRYDMTRETALLALECVFRSPSPSIKIEFQGGEPLLNFDLVRFIVEKAEERNIVEKRHLEFVLTTNLAFLTDEILDFLGKHSILVSTSLDGPAFIHNANRPRPGGDAYERTVKGIRLVRDRLGANSIAAVMTTSKLSLEHPIEIVDEYVSQGFRSIFLRPLSPYGFAARTQRNTGYDVESFLSFYKRALEHILSLNRAGVQLVESYSQILLSKILTPFATGYVDLQSPAGAGIGVAVYNYDGTVYASDEARMLAEMGDRAFVLGKLGEQRYEDMFDGPIVHALVDASIVESIPKCADCAYSTFCGADPIENHATQANMAGHRPTSSFCRRNMERIKHLLRLYHGADEHTRQILWSWVQRSPVDELLPVVPQ